MIKRFFLALAITAGLLSPAYSSGTIALSLTQRFDNATFRPLSGGKLYFIQAGTTSTPQNAYQDSGLTIPWANPLTLDSGGNIPQLFFADGSIKIRLTNSAGVTQLVADGIQVIGASSGGGGGSSVDATTLIATGDLKVRYGTGTLSGFVRANGRSIGSASSGATERANADCQALFEYLWQTDSQLSVSTGRGASAAADWAANKAINLPDWRGRAIAALDDMGNTAAGRLTFQYLGADPLVLGSAGGKQSLLLTLNEIPTGIQVSGDNTISVANAAQNISVANASQNISVANANQNISVANANQSFSASGTNSISASGTNSISVTSTVSDIVRHNPNFGFTAVASPGSGAYGFNTSAPTDVQVTSTNSTQNISVSNSLQNISVSGTASITASGTNSISASGTNSISASGTNNITASGSNTITATSTNTNGGTAAIVNPIMLATVYLKL